MPSIGTADKEDFLSHSQRKNTCTPSLSFPTSPAQSKRWATNNGIWHFIGARRDTADRILLPPPPPALRAWITLHMRLAVCFRVEGTLSLSLASPEWRSRPLGEEDRQGLPSQSQPKIPRGLGYIYTNLLTSRNECTSAHSTDDYVMLRRRHLKRWEASGNALECIYTNKLI